MKHYYDDEGVLQFDGFNKRLLAKLLDALSVNPSNYTIKKMQKDRRTVWETAVRVAYDYSIYESLGDLGGTKPFESYEEGSLEHVLAEMLKDFIDRGFIYQEFKMAAEDAICRLHIGMLLSDDM